MDGPVVRNSNLKYIYLSIWIYEKVGQYYIFAIFITMVLVKSPENAYALFSTSPESDGIGGKGVVGEGPNVSHFEWKVKNFVLYFLFSYIADCNANEV